MRLVSAVTFAAALAIGALAPSLPKLVAQAAAPQSKPAAGTPGQAGGGAGGASPFGDLVGAIKATKGCIGVEVAQTPSRKQAIFAWFEDKKATLDWYWSTYHQGAMAGLRDAAGQGQNAKTKSGDAAASEDHEPLQYVKDDCGPILCIATITPVAPGQKPAVPGFPAPISQISIELYTPLPGGIAFNGRFAPNELKVPHLVELAPPAATQPASGSPPVK